jgi:hypothetical protein
MVERVWQDKLFKINHRPFALPGFHQVQQRHAWPFHNSCQYTQCVARATHCRVTLFWFEETHELHMGNIFSISQQSILFGGRVSTTGQGL